MFIQTEITSNPARLTFLPSKPVSDGAIVSFATAQEAELSPLGRALFALPGIASVDLGPDFVTVTRTEDIDWSVLKPLVLSALTQALEETPSADDSAICVCPQDRKTARSQDPVTASIVSLLEKYVRPVLQQDGGDVAFHDFREGIVYVILQGACEGCPRRTMTLKHGIERFLKDHVPQVRSVESVE